MSLLAGLSTIALGGSWAWQSSTPVTADDTIRTHCERWTEAAATNDAIIARRQADLVAFISGAGEPARACAARGVAVTLAPRS